MTGSFRPARVRHTYDCDTRPRCVPLFLISTSTIFLTGLLFAGCGSRGGVATGAGVAYNGYNCLPGSYCYDNSGSTVDTTSTSPTTTGGVGGCSDSADAGCSGYDPVATDGGGDGSTSCCDTGNSGDTGGSAGDSGSSGDSGSGADGGGGDPGGGDSGGGDSGGGDGGDSGDGG